MSHTVKPESHERKTSSTFFEPNFKHALINTGQEDGLWPGPFWGPQNMATGNILQRLLNANP